MKKILTSLAIILALSSQIAFSQVTIIGIDIPGLHQKNGGGEYDNIINAGIVKNGKATLEVHPPVRAKDKFDNCTNCCFSPANKNPDFYEFGSGYVQTNPMAVAKIYIWTKKGSMKTAISSLSDLKGKKVGIRHGMPYGKTFEKAKLNTEAVKTIEQNIKKLNRGRIDAFVAYVPDAYAAFQKLGIEPYPHAKDKPIAVHEDALVCKGVSKQFIKDFNRSLKK